jgi:uncharacterized protein
MSEKLPTQIDLLSIARRGQVLPFVLSSEALGRLAEVTQGIESDAVGELRFSLFENRFPMVQLSVSINVRLMCQRSLVLFTYPLSVQADLVFAPEDATEWPESIELLSPEEAEEDPKVWIEDSLLLALPLVPVAPESKPVEYCVGEVEVVEEKAPNPFATLKELMKKE